ncbi:MAG: secretin N-terminal domain-containing protein, partial [Hydrogenovibrio sp.]|nr:secretin N-terminal domain-containing protein [Hydrogenovibrio sp.]
MNSYIHRTHYLKNAGRGFYSALCLAALLVIVPQPVVQAATSKDDTPVSLKQNFQNVDIRTVIEAVAKLTDKNFIIDPRVKGKVTLIAPEPMPADALYETLLSILRVHGYVAIPGPTAIRIIPANTARDQVAFDQKNTQGTPDADAWITEVLTVKHVSALKLVAILRPLVAREGHLVALESSNRLIVTDTRSNVKRIKTILKRVDVDPALGFDVVSIHNGSAEDIVQTLKGVLPKSPYGKDVKVDFDERTNQIILSGDAQQRRAVKSLISKLDTPLTSKGGAAVVYLHYSKAENLVPILQKLSASRSLINNKPSVQATSDGKAAATPPPVNLTKKNLNEKVSIEADERTNAIIISAPPQVTQALKGVIKQLDIRRAQVLIEAILVEVTESKQAELGVDWVANGPNGVGVINFSGTLPTIIANTGNPAAQANAIGMGASAAVGQISTDYKGWGALIRALNSDSDANVLA